MSFRRPDMSWACTWLRQFSAKISTEMCIRVRSERIWNQWVFWLIAREFCITSKWTGFTIDFTDFWKTLLLICITWDDQASPNHVTPKQSSHSSAWANYYTATYYGKMFLQISLQQSSVTWQNICEIQFLVEQAYFRTVVALWCCWTKSFLRNASKRAEISSCRLWDAAFDSGRSRPSVSFSDKATSASTEYESKQFSHTIKKKKRTSLNPLCKLLHFPYK